MVWCVYYINDDDLYACQIGNQKIPPQITEETFQGDHIKGQSNDDVKVLHIFASKIEKLPDAIGGVFKNLTQLRVWGSGLEIITKECLRKFPMLEELILDENEIRELPRDLFNFNLNLRKISLNTNKVQRIESGLLEDLANLEEFFIRWNHIVFVPGDLFKFNKKMKQIDFSHNEIKFIGYELLDGLHELIAVDFRCNPNINIWYDESRDNEEKLREVKRKIKQTPQSHEELEKLLEVQKIKSDQNKSENLTRNDEKIELNAINKRHTDLDSFLTREDFKDFDLTIDSTHFKVHKIVLMIRSGFFAEIFKHNPNMSEFTLEGIKPETFEVILKFLYTDETPKDLKNAREFFEAAGKLRIKSLKEISGQILMEELKKQKDLKELWKLFNLASKFECEEMKLRAFEEIEKNFPHGHLKNYFLEHPEKLKEAIEAKIRLDELIGE